MVQGAQKKTSLQALIHPDAGRIYVVGLLKRSVFQPIDMYSR